MYFDDVELVLRTHNILNNFVTRNELRRFFEDKRRVCFEFSYLDELFEKYGYEETIEVVKHILNFYKQEDDSLIEKMHKSFAGETDE